MTEPFDCAGLWEGVQRVWLAATGQAGIDHATADQLATDYLRTRIEAAFVPIEHHTAVITDHDELLQHEIARAEAAEAENTRLRKALRDIDRKNDNPACYNSDINAIIVAAIGGEHDK